MPLVFTMILISIPAVIFVAAGIALLTRRNEGAYERRWTIFLLVVAILMSIPLAIFAESVRTGTYGIILALGIPALIAVLSLILLKASVIYAQWKEERVLYSLLLIALGLLLVRMGIGDYGLLTILLVPTGILTLTWFVLRNMGWKALPFIAVVLLTLLLLEAIGLLDQHIVYTTSWLRSAYRVLSAVVIILTPFISVMMIGRGLELRHENPQHARVNLILGGLLSMALLATMFRHGLMVNATGHAAEDHMPFPAVGLAVVAGILLAFGLERRHFKLGVAFALFMALMMTLSYTAAWLIDPMQITNNRAERVELALQQYKVEQGGYPTNLSQLYPSQVLLLPRPLTGRGQIWCYQGGENYYRLGYAYFQRYYRWTSFHPFSEIRIHNSAGRPPDGPWMCDQELELIQSTSGL